MKFGSLSKLGETSLEDEKKFKMGKNDGVENIGDDVMMKIWDPMVSFLIYG